MKIKDLFEAAAASAAFAFGRFNPAHQGHIEVWRTVENAGGKWYVGTNPNTIGPNDPLSFQQKQAWMEEIYPPITGHITPQQSVMTLASKIFNDLGKNEEATISYITDADDWAWSGKLLNQYNGKEGAHGYYKFAQIVHVPSPRVSSATALRDAARADDKVAFYHASGTDPKSKVAGLTYFDTVKEAVNKYPLPVKKTKKVAESLRVDVPNEEWLNDAIEYAKEHSPDRRGLPYMGKTTATARKVEVPVDKLARIPGMRNEQQNVRQADLAAIMKIMKDTGKLPLDDGTGEEYKPFINVAYDGSAWVNEGNHRIMAAHKLGFKTLPVEISYFDGGERIKDGHMYPGKIGLGEVDMPKTDVAEEQKTSEAVEPHAAGYQKDILTMPEYTVVIDTPGDLDWYKIGQHFPNLNKEDPDEYGQSDTDMTVTLSNQDEMNKFLGVMKRLGISTKVIGGTNKQPEIHSE